MPIRRGARSGTRSGREGRFDRKTAAILPSGAAAERSLPLLQGRLLVDRTRMKVGTFNRCLLAVAGLVSWAGIAHARAEASKPLVDFPPKSISPVIVENDIAAADRWVRDYYAGWVDPDNRDFRLKWARAVVDARRQAERVSNVADWQLVMKRLIGVARDGHAQLGRTSYPEIVRWAGVSVASSGDGYTLRSSEHAELDRAELVACDGVPARVLVERRIDRYHADWTNPSERQRGVARLFVDQGETLLRPIGQCEVRKNDRACTWRPMFTERALADVRRAANAVARRGTGPSEFVVRTTPEGALWIAVPSLMDSTAAARQRADLTSDPRRLSGATHLVFDVRGNGGGNSELGDALLMTALGLKNLPDAGGPLTQKMWRASPGIVQLLEAARTASTTNPEAVAFLDKVLPPLRTAVAERRTLVRDPDATASPSATAQTTVVPRLPRLFVLTDGDCFSSCILFVNRVRALGGLQVGDPTNRNEPYGENWFERTLPSGLGSVGLPLAIDRTSDELRGGRAPDLPWAGEMSDQRGIEKFISSKVSS